MAARAKKRPAARAPATAAESTSCAIKTHYNGGGDFENFAFLRGYYKGEGPRTGLQDRVDKKLNPVPPDGKGRGYTASRVDVLLPPFAPSDYLDPLHLAHMYETTLPQKEWTAFAQITPRFPRALNLHYPWEVARAFAYSEIVDALRLPVLAVLHAPNLAGSPNPPHVHLFVFPRELSQFGFGAVDRSFASDRGHVRMHTAWQEYISSQTAKWGKGILDCAPERVAK